ncbi:HEAT repeat-containing protein 6 [Quaeritorhiza haematococci]|nr:HEAT repeat-containing protein 6 [Quaeritorhiza haematococci]
MDENWRRVGGTPAEDDVPTTDNAAEVGRKESIQEVKVVNPEKFDVMRVVLELGLPVVLSQPVNKFKPLPFVVSVFELLAAVARNCPKAFIQNWTDLKPALSKGFKDDKEMVRAASIKVVEQYFQSMAGGNEAGVSDNRNDADDMDSRRTTGGGGGNPGPLSPTTDHTHTDHPDFTDVKPWREILDAFITGPGALRDSSYAVRALGCECLALIPETVFEMFEPQRRYAYFTLALGMTEDEDPNVRAAACRTLGVYVSYQLSKEDSFFILDVASTLPKHVTSDQTLNVRVRGSWALANLCDALGAAVLNKRSSSTESDAGVEVEPNEGGESAEGEGQLNVPSKDSEVGPTFVYDGESDEAVVKGWQAIGVSESGLRDIVLAGLNASKDHDKCRSNGVRALGNIVKICPESFVKREQERLLRDVVLCVCRNAETGNVKTRWNACHALGNMFTNAFFPLETASWSTNIFTALLSALGKCKNFKVRINAATALEIVAHRQLRFGWHCSHDDEHGVGIGIGIGRGQARSDNHFKPGPRAFESQGRAGVGVGAGGGMYANLPNILDTMTSVIENMDEDVGGVSFGEYKYREQLLEQLKKTYRVVRDVIVVGDGKDGGGGVELRSKREKLDALMQV